MQDNYLGNHMIVNAVCNLWVSSLLASEFLKVFPNCFATAGGKSSSDLRNNSSAIFGIPRMAVGSCSKLFFCFYFYVTNLMLYSTCLMFEYHWKSSKAISICQFQNNFVCSSRDAVLEKNHYITSRFYSI